MSITEASVGYWLPVSVTEDKSSYTISFFVHSNMQCLIVTAYLDSNHDWVRVVCGLHIVHNCGAKEDLEIQSLEFQCQRWMA